MRISKIVTVFLALILVLGLFGCATPEPVVEEPVIEEPITEEPAVVEPTTEVPVVEEPVVETPTEPEKVIVAIGGDPADLSPFTGMSMGRIAILKTVYEYLLEFDSMGAKPVPLIAKSYENTGDKTVTVTLFDYVNDSAGNHITAEDVAWSFNTAMAGGMLRPLGDLESVTATGDYTVDFVFKKEMGTGGVEKVLTEVPIVSKAHEAILGDFALAPITTSAYVLKEYVPGSKLVFEKRADYWQTDPEFRSLFSQANVKTIEFQVITEPAQHAIALETGSADISASVTGADITRFMEGGESAEGFTVFKFKDNLTQLLAFNGSEGSPFTSKELRQAVAYAIDTAAMCEAVSPGACAPAHTIGNENFGGYLAKWEEQPYYEYDLEKAKELMATAGYEPGQLTIKLLGQNDPRTSLMAQVIQAYMTDLGIAMEINLVEAPTFNELILDPTQFDVSINAAAGGDFIFSPWQLMYDQNRNNGTTSTWFKDDKLQGLLDTASSLTGFTPENVDAFYEYDKENLFNYGLLSYYNLVVAKEGILEVVRDTRGQIIPGACVFAADF